MSGFGRRLREERKRAGLSTRALARLAGMSQGRVSQLENNPEGAVLASTAMAFARVLGVSPEYLQKGGRRQAMTPFVRAWELSGESDVSHAQMVLVPTAALRNIPPTPFRLPLTENGFVVTDNPIAVPVTTIERLRLDPSQLLAIDAEDDATERIRKGDTLLLDTKDTRLLDANVYLLAYGDQIAVRRVFVRPDGNVVLHADDPKYPSHTVSVSAIRVLGRVIQVLADL